MEILDAKTLTLVSGAPVLLDKAPSTLKKFLKPEAYQSMIELVTPVCQDLEEIEAFFLDKLSLLERLAERHGLLIFAASLHPFVEARDQILFQDPRYKAIFRELQLVGRRFIAQGLHVHLGMPDQEAAIKLYNALLPYLPLFLALTTSSPFYEGENTGFHSYRTKLFEVLPLAGLPRSFSCWDEYEHLLRFLAHLEIIESVRDLWWDIRIQPHLGTLEIRICDTPTRFKDLLAVVALIKALAIRLLEDKTPRLPREAILYGKWQASRHGLEGFIVEPFRGGRVPLKRLAMAMMDYAYPVADDLGFTPYWEGLKDILNRGPGSYRMLALFEQGANFAEIIETLRGEFWK